MTVAVLDPPTAPAVQVRPARLNLPAAHTWVVVEMFEIGTLARCSAVSDRIDKAFARSES